MHARFPNMIEGYAVDSTNTFIRHQIISRTDNVLHYCVSDRACLEEIDNQLIDNMIDILAQKNHLDYNSWRNKYIAHYNQFLAKLSTDKQDGFIKGIPQECIIYDIYTDDEDEITGIDIRAGKAIMTRQMDHEGAHSVAFNESKPDKTLAKWHNVILKWGKQTGFFYEEQQFINFATVTSITTQHVRRKLFEFTKEKHIACVYRMPSNKETRREWKTKQPYFFGNTMDITGSGILTQNTQIVVPATSANNAIDRINIALGRYGCKNKEEASNMFPPQFVTSIAHCCNLIAA